MHLVEAMVSCVVWYAPSASPSGKIGFPIWCFDLVGELIGATVAATFFRIFG